MSVHPGPEQSNVPEERRAELGPIRRGLKENEDWCRDLVEHSHDLLCTHDLAGRLLSVNPAPARVLGYSVEELLRIPMREIIAPDFRPQFDAYLRQIERTGESRGFMAVMTRSGERRIWQYNNTLRTEGVASPTVRGIAHDVTEQRETEKLLGEVDQRLRSEVRESERTIRELKLFQTLVDQSNDAIEVVDPETLRFLNVNERACSDLGYSREELRSMRVFDIDPAVTESSAAKIKEELRKSGSLVIESVHRRKDGITFPVEISMRWVRLERDYIVTIARDLTERKLAEARLRASESRYRAVHDRSPVGICWIETRTGRLLGVNPKYCEILGRTEPDLLSRNFQSLTHPDDLPSSLEKLRQLTEGEVRHYEVEKRFLRPDGSVRWAEVEVVAMWPEGEDPVWHMAIVQDITERKQAEERLREYERVVEGLEEMIVVVDREHRYVIANHAFLNYRGMNKDQVVGHHVNEVVNRGAFEQVMQKVEECFQGKVVEYEMKYTYPTLGERDLFVKHFPIEGPTGVDRIASILQDITERKRAEEALRKSERTQKLILDHLSVGVILSSVGDERTLYQNPKFLDLFGYSIEQFPTMADWWPLAFPDPKYREWVSHEWQRRMAEAAKTQGEIDPMELTVTCHDGAKKHVRALAKAIGDRNFITFIDLSERKQAEEAVRESELRFRAVYERSPVGIALVDPRSGRFLQTNPKFCEIAGRSEEELLRIDVGSITHPDDIGHTREYLRQLAEEERASYEMDKRYLRPDGSVRWVRIFAVSMWGKGETPRWHMGLVQDVTEQKLAEEALKKSEEKFSKAFRLSPMSITLTSIKDHRYIEVNGAFERMSGWRRDEVIGRTPFDLGLWVNPAERVELAKGLLAKGCLRNMEVLVRRKDGAIRIGLGTAELIELDGETCAITVGTDITERNQAEEALRRSEENYRMFVSQSSEGIFREDMDAPISIDLPEDELVHHILYDSYMAECNDAQAAMYGLKSGQEFVGKRLTELLPPEDPHNIELTRDYIRSGFRILDRESHEIDVHGNPKVFLNSMIGTVENGKLVRTWGIQRDVTEKVKLEESRRQAEEALRRNVAQLREVTEELQVAKEKLSEEKLYLEQAIDTELGFGEIIGRSRALKEVMAKVGKVAPNDATVLLLGETGTGKELVARAIHRMSKRKDNSFIKLNCAAIPSGLLESELFGHEKGAFTGAIARKLGRLELADKGTLFLDEIGDIPLGLQPKLLRVLQDQEFERLGGTQTLKVDFRLVAATNRDLLQSVDRREFRSDLYYRLNVFPILIPPLRERQDDIPLLIEHFVRKYASRMNKSILSIPTKTMETLVQWAWPGNIRELENFVERSVILTPGSVLQAPLAELHTEPDKNENETLREKERESIIRALRESNGQLGGPNGAAARLGLKRTTLQSKLTQFGINPADYRK